MSCHSRIESVHEQVIRGELWEKTPGAIPACTDCHLPHKVRKEELAFTLADRECLKCHTDPAALTAAGSDTLVSPGLLVDHDVIEESVHKNIPCVKCHADIDPRRKRPCETAEQTDCSNCHAKISDEYLASGHAKGRVAGDLEAPTCITCHGDHDVKSHTDETAATYRAAVPQLCGNCHREDGVASSSSPYTNGRRSRTTR